MSRSLTEVQCHLGVVIDSRGPEYAQAVKSSLDRPRYKTESRVMNWREYERGLRGRGDATIWFSENAIANWISRGV